MDVKIKNQQEGNGSWKGVQISNLARRRSPKRIGRDIARTLINSTRVNEPKIQIQA